MIKLKDLLMYINKDELVSFYYPNGTTSDVYEVGELLNDNDKIKLFDDNLLDMNVPQNGIVTFCDLADLVVADNSRRRTCAGFVGEIKISYMVITLQ